MKTITTLIVAAALSLSAQAQTAVVGPNHGGGMIVLTPQPCTNQTLSKQARDNSRYVYSFTRDGTVISGCYFLKDNSEVHVLWHIGTNGVNVYPISNFAVR